MTFWHWEMVEIRWGQFNTHCTVMFHFSIRIGQILKALILNLNHEVIEELDITAILFNSYDSVSLAH